MTLRALILYIHLLAALLWIGEMLVMTLILGPVSRRLYSPEQRIELYRAFGRRSRPWIWAAMVLLVLSGIGNLWTMGTPVQALWQPAYYATEYGRTLGIKLLFVFLIFSITIIHDIGSMRYGQAMRRRHAQSVPEGSASPVEATVQTSREHGEGASHRTSVASGAAGMTSIQRRYRSYGLWLGRLSLLLGLVIVYLGVVLVTMKQ